MQKIMVSLNKSRPVSGVFYRGIAGTFDPTYLDNQRIIWVTQNKEYASLYSDGAQNIHEFKVNIKNSFRFRFRTLSVHVKLEDIMERILSDLMDKYGTELLHATVLEIEEQIEVAAGKYSKNKMMLVWEWWDQVPEIAHILKAMGYDSIMAREGNNNDITTYGLFDKRMLRKL